MKIKDLVLIGLYVSLFIVLDVFFNYFELLQMPQGGSLRVSIIPLIISSYHLGYKKSLFVCILSVLLMIVTGPIYTVDIFSFLLDYVVSFGVFGFCCLFKNYKNFYIGILITCLISLLSLTLSGYLYWNYPFLASLSYNASYMIPTTILNLIVVPIIYNIIKPILK